MNRARALSQLSSCLRGRVPPGADWPAILAMANEALITPELHSSLSIQPLPEDVRRFLAEVHDRNAARNASLFQTLKDALVALNGAGIEPVLLKGCAMWTACGAPDAGRMVSDLDLLVGPSEARAAVAALTQAGFAMLEDHQADDEHAAAVLGRARDAGSIDLHVRPPCPVGIAALDDLHAHCREVALGGFRARAPRPELQILIASLHDQVHDGGFWMGDFNLRHLIDIASLTRSAANIDWRFLTGACPTRFLREVLQTQLLAAKRIAGADVPEWCVARPWVEAQYARLRLQFVFPRINAPLRWFGRMIRWRDLPSRTRVVGAAARNA